MCRILICCFLLLFSYVACPAANDPPPSVGARAAALGNAYVGIRSDFWTIFHNPAGIAGMEQITAGAYVVRRFNLAELTTASGGLVMPFLQNEHSLGLDFSNFGFAAYRENRVGLSYATSLLDKVSIGVKLNYASVAIPRYGSESNLYVDIGLVTKLSPVLSLGFSAMNINRAKLGLDPTSETLPSLVTAGLAYQPNDRALVVLDVQKDIDHPLSVRAGVEYFLNNSICARVGTSTEPLSWHAGFGLVRKELKIDFAFGFTERLGFSPHISLNYGF